MNSYFGHPSFKLAARTRFSSPLLLSLLCQLCSFMLEQMMNGTLSFLNHIMCAVAHDKNTNNNTRIHRKDLLTQS
jgi:hypothetical protein